MSGLLSPKVDFVFKKIFGNEQHPEVLVSFLNAILTPKDIIKSVEINNTDIDKNSLEDKMSRLDIKATTNTGEMINIEMQMRNEHNIDERTLYYWARTYSEQLKQSQDYKILKRTICINLLNYSHVSEECYHNAYRIKNIKNNNELTDLLEIHYIELKKFNLEGEAKEMLEKWLNFINEPQEYVKKPPQDKELEIALDCLRRISSSDEERAKYDKRLESILEYNSFINTRKRIEQALEEAEEKGRKDAQEEEREKMVKMVKNMFSCSMALEDIVKITGLSVEEVNRINKES